MKYTAEFSGRLKNAIGVTYRIITEVEGSDEEEARLNLYDRYEHISEVKFEPIQEDSP